MDLEGIDSRFVISFYAFASTCLDGFTCVFILDFKVSTPFCSFPPLFHFSSSRASRPGLSLPPSSGSDSGSLI